MLEKQEDITFVRNLSYIARFTIGNEIQFSYFKFLYKLFIQWFLKKNIGTLFKNDFFKN